MANKFLVTIVGLVFAYLMTGITWLMHSVSEIQGDLKVIKFQVNLNTEQLNAHSQMLGNLRDDINHKDI